MGRCLSLVLYCMVVGGATAFLPLLSPMASTPRSPLCLSSNEDNESSLDALRRQLESSWNIETMGQVPTSAKSAAEAAAGALNTARERTQEASIFFVDILLPQYDITQGKNLYDEVLAAEFCTELATVLPGKSMILVKDGKTLRTINRVFQARQKNNDGNSNKDSDTRTGDPQNNIEIYDDFADVGIIGDPTPGEVDDFRKKLISSWDDDKQKSAETVPSSPTSLPAARKYRLASMIGDAKVSRGPDMADDVMNALAVNAKAADDEDTIIILSAIDPEDLIAVRALVTSYKRKKSIVLVNSKLDPVPRELIGAQTVYSILPLLARAVQSDNNIFGSSTSERAATTTPKVVVLRRYPRDWEVYVDVEGMGFELAASVPSDQVGSRGPSMEWIASSVKKHLQARMG